jgi:hypothetical protein
MRLSSMAAVCAVLLSAGMSAAVADPVELVCKYDAAETHLYIDLSAATVNWFGKSYRAKITDTQVYWEGDEDQSGTEDVPYFEATFDRDTGTLVIDRPPGSDKDGTTWARGHYIWACAKAQKIL